MEGIFPPPLVSSSDSDVDEMPVVWGLLQDNSSTDTEGISDFDTKDGSIFASM